MITLVEDAHKFASIELDWSRATVTLDTTLQMTGKRAQVF